MPRPSSIALATAAVAIAVGSLGHAAEVPRLAGSLARVVEVREVDVGTAAVRGRLVNRSDDRIEDVRVLVQDVRDDGVGRRPDPPSGGGTTAPARGRVRGDRSEERRPAKRIAAPPWSRRGDEEAVVGVTTGEVSECKARADRRGHPLDVVRREG